MPRMQTDELLKITKHFLLQQLKVIRSYFCLYSTIVMKVGIKALIFHLSIGWELWRAPVIQLLGDQSWWTV